MKSEETQVVTHKCNMCFDGIMNKLNIKGNYYKCDTCKELIRVEDKK